MANYDHRGASVYLCSPTNSTIFTRCCDTAILSHEKKCPSCDGLVYGHDAESDHVRGRMRWSMAFNGRG